MRTEELRSDVHSAEGVGSGGWGLFWFFFGIFGIFGGIFWGVAFAKTWETLYFGLNKQLVGAVNNGYSLRLQMVVILFLKLDYLTRYGSEMINTLFPDAGFA